MPRTASDHSPAAKAAFALADRVARLNPKAGEIGAGMLAQLVADARRILDLQPEGDAQ